MKYSATILLFAAAVFWSSASARPAKPDIEQGILIDAFTRGVIQGLNEYVPEPHRSILTKKVHDVQYQKYDSLDQYMNHIKSIVTTYVRETGLEASRRKRDVDSDEELNTDELETKIVYGVYARMFVLLAPEAHREALTEKYSVALEKEYENEDDFLEEAAKIFEEETGLDAEKVVAEVEADEEKLAELQKTILAEVANALGYESDSLEED